MKIPKQEQQNKLSFVPVGYKDPVIKNAQTAPKKKRLAKLVGPQFSTAIPFQHKLCLLEMQTFVQGGVPGLARLQKVSSTIFKAFGVEKMKEQETIFIRLGLHLVSPLHKKYAQFEIPVPSSVNL